MVDDGQGGCGDGALPTLSFPTTAGPNTEAIASLAFAWLELVGMVSLSAAVLVLGIDGHVGGTATLCSRSERTKARH